MVAKWTGGEGDNQAGVRFAKGGAAVCLVREPDEPELPLAVDVVVSNFSEYRT
jgi:hypothetical protein